MKRWLSPLLYLVFGVGLLVSAYSYVWARLIRDVAFPLGVERALTVAWCGLAVSLPVGIVASRFVSRRWSRWWMPALSVWLGVSVFLLAAVALVELLPSVVSARAAAGIAVALTALTSVAALREGRQVRVKRVELPLAKLARSADGFRVVQLTDLHVGPTLGVAFVERVVSAVNQLGADVVVVTGDLVDGTVEDLAPHVAPLGGLRAKHGVFFVTGNHEYHAGAVEWCAHLERLGLRVLHNERVGVGNVQLAGIDDYEAEVVHVGHRVDVAKAVAGRDDARPLILLAHQPRAIHEAVKHGVDLQLSGHTHGGQLWPLRWFSRIGQPLASGLARFGDTLLYVSCGTGHSGPPMRLGVPAEITELVLRGHSARR